MNLEGAVSFSENDISNIYTISSSSSGQYCVIIPKKVDGVMSMLVDLSKKDLFDSLTNGVIDKDSLVKEINDEYLKLRETYNFCALIFPMIDKKLFDSVVNNNDKQKMFDETKRIASFTSDFYKKIIDTGLDKAMISQKIIMVETDDVESKFVSWLKEQQPNFVDGVEYKKSVSSVQEAPVSNDSFLNVQPIVEDVKVNDQNASNDVVSTPLPVVNEDSSNVNDNSLEEVSEDNQESVETNIEKKSAGFANLLILLVILVVVTFVSIEIGKYLFNVFGK